MSAKIIFKIRNISGGKRVFPSNDINTKKDKTMMNVYASINRALAYIKMDKIYRRNVHLNIIV